MPYTVRSAISDLFPLSGNDKVEPDLVLVRVEVEVEAFVVWSRRFASTSVQYSFFRALGTMLFVCHVIASVSIRSVLTTWVELQTTVNCYMDSSKDPRGLKDTPPGLRQVQTSEHFIGK